MKKILLILSILIFAKINFANAQNEKFKALFLYNFTKYIEWPGSYKSGDFVISVIGNSKIVNELKTIASKKKVGAQKIVVKVLSNPSQLSKSHIVFLPANKSSNLGNALTAVNGKNTLLVTDGSSLVQKGSGISFVQAGGKQSFEIKKNNIEKRGLKVSGSLLSLGSVVN